MLSTLQGRGSHAGIQGTIVQCIGRQRYKHCLRTKGYVLQHSRILRLYNRSIARRKTVGRALMSVESGMTAAEAEDKTTTTQMDSLRSISESA